MIKKRKSEALNKYNKYISVSIYIQYISPPLTLYSTSPSLPNFTFPPHNSKGQDITFHCELCGQISWVGLHKSCLHYHTIMPITHCLTNLLGLIGGNSWWEAERAASHPHIPLLLVKWSILHIIKAAFFFPQHMMIGATAASGFITAFAITQLLVAKQTTRL